MAAAWRLAALAVLALCFAAGSAASSQRSAHAVQKVIEMLNGMLTTAKQEKDDEEVAFARFAAWCSGETGRLQADSAKAGEKVNELSARIGKLESDADTLGKELEQLNNNLADAEAKKKVATAQRERDREAFVRSSRDLAESVDALDRAVEVMQEQNYDRPGSKATLLQLSHSEELPRRARSLLAQYALMLDTGNREDADSFDEAPEANAYEFQSSGLIDTLSSLKDSFATKLGTSQKEEMNSKHAYDLIVADLVDTIENAEREAREKTAEKARKVEKASLDKKQMTATSNVKAATEEALATATAECGEGRATFQEKQALRAEELEAIVKAIDILQSPEVQEVARQRMALMQPLPAATALVQLEGRRGRRRVRDFLAAEGRRLRSQHLALLAQKLAADPFAKVKQLVSEMISRLQEEANTDADHEGFCDTEMGKSKITRNKLSEDIDGLSAAVQEGKATILALTESTQTLLEEITKVRTALGEAADIRREEKAKNAQTIKEAQAAQVAVARAQVVLKDFYEKALTATSLVQATTAQRWGMKHAVTMGSEEWKALGKPDAENVDSGHTEDMQSFLEAYAMVAPAAAPEAYAMVPPAAAPEAAPPAAEAYAMFSPAAAPEAGMPVVREVYRGQGDKSEYGVLTLLEVVQADFEGLEADAKSAEVESARAFESFTHESEKSISVKEQKISMDTADKTAAEERLARDASELKAMQRELQAAESYHKQLVPQCMDQGMTFEERTKAREAEVESLRQALEMLGS